MATFWIAVATAAVTAVISGIPPSVIALIKHRQLVESERQRDELTRDNEFHQRKEAALTRALSTDPTQRDIGLAGLVELRDSPLSTPERAAHIQTLIDRINLTLLGRTLVEVAEWTAIQNETRPSQVVPPPGNDPYSRALHAMMTAHRQRDQELTSKIKESNEQLRKMGLNMINGISTGDGFVPDAVKGLRPRDGH
ncbi:hypothetical protein P5V43_12760 [Mycobacteroides abscessus subsp. bolletii]|uniref:hypothetical protein n=1 Tax=Mycobacteroides abscessus TaxID=36809 RepID=UPI00266BAED8|nr:hypothetical protein [Mycobacteroides abscessus]MDO3127975.1 hypothetical protein [Mycobacteroides abscessus subsp. bolletii]